MDNRKNRMPECSTSPLSELTKEILTITDEITNTSLELRVDFSSPSPDTYGTLIRKVDTKFGLHGDTFRLKNVEGNTLYPRCLEHMNELQCKSLAEIGIKGDDKLVIVRTWHANSQADLCQDSTVTMTNKMNQTEPDNSTDLIRVHMVPSGRARNDYDREAKIMAKYGYTVPSEREWYEANEFDIYVRQYYRIIDLSDEFKRVSLNGSTIHWTYKGKTFSEEDTTTLTTEGISDGSVIEYFLECLPLECWRRAGVRETIRSTRTIGVQTVAKPAVQYPPAQPPPPVNNPPPAKT